MKGHGGERFFATCFSRAMGGLIAPLVVLVLGAAPSISADLRVFTSGAPAEVQKTFAPKFVKSTGNHVLFTVGTLSEIRQKLSGPETPDIVVLPAPVINGLSTAGSLLPGSRVDLARVGIGVVVRAGSRLPDISSVAALRKTLLNARSVAHPDPKGGGFAGAQIARMFEQMGIADAIKPKTTLMNAITGGVARIASGASEIGLFNISEILPVKGVTLVGPLPKDLQSYIVFAGAVHKDSVSPEVAKVYLQSLSGAPARDAWRKGGFETITGGR
jgi:molybdate transport system substrate-binding protein